VFEALTKRLTAMLHTHLADCDVCIAHNVHTLHKNIPLSAALAHLAQTGHPNQIAWCHDLAWTNIQYQNELHSGAPWDVLRQVWPHTRYVTVSEPRRFELAELLGVSPKSITVMVPGVDPAHFFHWTATTVRLDAQLNLLAADYLLLLPARLTRRKNIDLALRVLAALRAQTGLDARLLVTGPPGPHNPTNMGYLGELLETRERLGLGDSAHFLYAYSDAAEKPLLIDDATMANLFLMADALFFPSLQEGFGIPILEAGLAGLPVFCADIPPFCETGREQVVYFDPAHADPNTVANQIVTTLAAYPPAVLRRRVRQQYRWDTLIREQLVPMLEV
jgi:glycosyltransferase involved in cell wall biosynthesis